MPKDNTFRSIHRFFVPPEYLADDRVHLSGEVAHQIVRVLRMRAGDEVCLLDGSGREFRVRLVSLDKSEVVGQIEEKARGKGEPGHKVTLYISLLNKPDKFEWALQKGTEIGAGGFVPMRSARSISDAPGRARSERWQRIMQEAAEQSGRAVVPTLGEVLTFEESVKATAGQPAIIPALGSQVALKAALASARGSLSIFIGPEGGFTPEELEAAEAAGIIPVTLGPRTLRAETAAVVALTMALYELGELDPKEE
jgi:16S rRNA (uracil1498-N3)-methyltransferase